MDYDDDLKNLERCWVHVAVDYLLYPEFERSFSQHHF